jgi:hypothetical protein
MEIPSKYPALARRLASTKSGMGRISRPDPRLDRAYGAMSIIIAHLAGEAKCRCNGRVFCCLDRGCHDPVALVDKVSASCRIFQAATTSGEPPFVLHLHLSGVTCSRCK